MYAVVHYRFTAMYRRTELAGNQHNELLVRIRSIDRCRHGRREASQPNVQANKSLRSWTIEEQDKEQGVFGE